MKADELTGRRIVIKGGVRTMSISRKWFFPGDITANFTLRLGLKNLSLALDRATNGSTPMVLSGTSRQLHSLAIYWRRSQVDGTDMLLLVEDIARCQDET